MILSTGKHFIKQYPSQAILCALLALIGIGTALLSLSLAQQVPLALMDVFFTVTSLTTATGLLTIPLDSFTWFGQGIILLIMQIGGLGLMTMMLFLISLFMDLGLYTKILANDILSIQSFKDTKRVLLFMITLTFGCELIGALINFYALYNHFPVSQTIFISIFHAVSSFCNTGVTLFSNDLISFSGNKILLLNTLLLITMGGLGFITWHEFFMKYIKQVNKKISWHTKLVLKMFFITTAISALLFWILERNNTLAGMGAFDTLCNVAFMSLSMKSAGFLSVSLGLLQPATLLLFLIFAFIGSAPASTGSGIKVSTFAIFIAVIHATLNGRPHAEIYLRRINQQQVYKAMAIIALSASWVIFTIFCMLITEHHLNFLEIIFETVSAFANFGMTKSTTPLLSYTGKCFIAIDMIVGRIGALSLIISMKRTTETEFLYPEEKVVLG